MALVPEEVLDRFERKQRIETSPITSDLMRDDIRLSDTLEHSDLSDVDKQKLYNTSLERYLELRRQKDSQVPTVRFALLETTCSGVTRSGDGGSYTENNASESYGAFETI